MNTNQTIGGARKLALKVLNEFSSLAEQLIEIGTQMALRESLKAKAQALILHDRAMYLGTKGLNFQIDNSDLIMKGRWSWVRWNRSSQQ